MAAVTPNMFKNTNGDTSSTPIPIKNNTKRILIHANAAIIPALKVTLIKNPDLN
jgi:hypothetical protein